MNILDFVDSEDDEEASATRVERFDGEMRAALTSSDDMLNSISPKIGSSSFRGSMIQMSEEETLRVRSVKQSKSPKTDEPSFSKNTSFCLPPGVRDDPKKGTGNVDNEKKEAGCKRSSFDAFVENEEPSVDKGEGEKDRLPASVGLLRLDSVPKPIGLKNGTKHFLDHDDLREQRESRGVGVDGQERSGRRGKRGSGDLPKNTEQYETNRRRKSKFRTAMNGVYKKSKVFQQKMLHETEDILGEISWTDTAKVIAAYIVSNALWIAIVYYCGTRILWVD